MKGKLRDISDRVENAGYTGSDEDSKVVSELMEEIRAVIIDYKVSCETRTGSQSKLLMNPVSCTLTQYIWGFTSTGTEDLFRT